MARTEIYANLMVNCKPFYEMIAILWYPNAFGRKWNVQEMDSNC